MSDFGRQNISDKIESAVKPDSEKSYAEQAKEQISSTIDNAAKNLTPEEQKSAVQTLTDKATTGADKASDEGKSYIEQVQDTASSALKNAADYIQGK